MTESMENKFLITPAEVVALAFDAGSGLGPEDIPEGMILSAQEKFIRPVLNELYPRLEAGDLPDFLETFIKPALAYYVRLLLLPVMAVSTDKMGLVVLNGTSLKAADAEQRSMLVKRTRADACALMRRAIRHVEENPEMYPEYRPAKNVLHRLSICSQVVL